jgi:hypothetical protein
MQKKIQTSLCKLAFLCLFVSAMATGTVMAQISLSGEAPLEIRFSKDQSQDYNYTKTISLSDLQQIINLETDFQISGWKHFGDTGTDDESFYIEDGLQFVSPGRVQLSGSDDQTFFAISFKNESDIQFASTVVAFDFKYHTQNILQDYLLTLHYKVNDGNWRRADGGSIRTSSLGETETGEWETFSTQLHIDDIYLRENDQFHLKWIFDGVDEIEPGLSLALQGIEITPEKSRVAELGRGDLIITEILPATSIDGNDFEYIEIYNPADRAVELKGLEIVSGRESRVIQRNVEIPAYGLFVLSNLDISGFEGVRHSYSYNGSMISSSGGRVELIQYNSVVSSATYEVQEAGTAMQLDRMLNAYDGYTSLQNMHPSSQSFYPEIAGSPGQFGSTIPLFRKTIERDGWHLISPPGRFVTRLNRASDIHFYTLDMEPVSMDQIEPFTPVFIRKEGNNPVTLFAEAEARPNETSAIEMIEQKRYLNLGVFRTPEITDLNRVIRENDERLAPVLNVWNEQRQRFEPGFTREISLNNWTPFNYNHTTNENLNVDRAGTSSTGAVLDRYIPFRLYDGSGNSKVFIDEAVLGFMSQPGQSEEKRYDLPRLTTQFPEDTAPRRESLIYLASQVTDTPANSFIHFPHTPDETYRAGLGYQFAVSSGNASIEWDLRNDIPDEWVLTLEDTHTGNIVDMREVNSYRFRYNTEVPDEDPGDGDKGLIVFEPAERNRFVVTIEPFEAVFNEEAGEERSGSIELRQNYPNPFNPATNITFYLPEDRPVKVGIYNIVGQQVAVLADETMSAGEHSIVWDAGSNPSGIYIVQLETGNRILTRKITLIK